MGSRSVVAKWEGGMRCRVDAGRFRLTVDEPESAGGTDAGPQPTDLFLASVASCFTLAMAWSARRRGVELTAVQVTAEGQYAGPRFESITIAVRAAGPEADIDELAAEAQRVCYVTNTLRELPRVEVVSEDG